MGDSASIETDPDAFALAIVQQYLKEHGFHRALAALEHETGVTFMDTKLRRGSELLSMAYARIEAQLGAEGTGEAAGRRARLEESLLRGGADDYPRRLAASIEGPFTANITCLACWPAQRRAAAGLGDGSVQLFGYGGEALGVAAVGRGGVLCMAAQPSGETEQPGPLLAVGCMDGSVHLVDISDPAAPRACGGAQPHRKYVVALKWSPDGRYLVAGSWDQSFTLLRVAAAGAGGPAGEAEAAGSSKSNSRQDWRLEVVHQEQCGAQVTDVEFLQHPAVWLDSSNSSSSNNSSGAGSGAAAGCGGGGEESGRSSGAGRQAFLVAVRGSNYLREYAIAEGGDSSGGAAGGMDATPGGPAAAAAAAAAGPAVVEQRRLNMNALQDDYVSFTAANLALSPCCQLLLVSTDTGRLIIFDLQAWAAGETAQVRNFYGLPTEQFHQFCAAWHAGGHYVMAAAARGGVYVYEVGSARVVATLAAHPTKNVRGLVYDGNNNLLLTCSFDRTVKLFET